MRQLLNQHIYHKHKYYHHRQGEVEHRDSIGNVDVITQGGVQWMTAARGIIHEGQHLIITFHNNIQ